MVNAYVRVRQRSWRPIFFFYLDKGFLYLFQDSYAKGHELDLGLKINQVLDYLADS